MQVLSLRLWSLGRLSNGLTVARQDSELCFTGSRKLNLATKLQQENLFQALSTPCSKKIQPLHVSHKVHTVILVEKKSKLTLRCNETDRSPYDSNNVPKKRNCAHHAFDEITLLPLQTKADFWPHQGTIRDTPFIELTYRE